MHLQYAYRENQKHSILVYIGKAFAVNFKFHPSGRNIMILYWYEFLRCIDRYFLNNMAYKAFSNNLQGNTKEFTYLMFYREKLFAVYSNYFTLFQNLWNWYKFNHIYYKMLAIEYNTHCICRSFTGHTKRFLIQ